MQACLCKQRPPFFLSSLPQITIAGQKPVSLKLSATFLILNTDSPSARPPFLRPVSTSSDCRDSDKKVIVSVKRTAQHPTRLEGTHCEQTARVRGNHLTRFRKEQSSFSISVIETFLYQYETVARMTPMTAQEGHMHHAWRAHTLETACILQRPQIIFDCFLNGKQSESCPLLSCSSKSGITQQPQILV